MNRKHWQSAAILVLGCWAALVSTWCLALHNRQTEALAAFELEQIRKEIERMHYNQRSIANYAYGLGAIHAIRDGSAFRPLAFRHRDGDRKLWDDPGKWTPVLFPFIMDDHGNPITLEPDGTVTTHYDRR